MIGNDIVDFVQAHKDSNWRRRGWLDKIFVPEEQKWIENTDNPDHMVWLLWSMKEAVYKAHQRTLQHAPRYNPKSFVCSSLATTNSFLKTGQSQSKGRIYTAGYCYETTSVMTTDFVHTTACLTTFLIGKKVAKVIENPKTTAIFTNAKSHLANEMSNKYEFRKDTLGIPQIFEGTNKTPFLISLSHHGRFGSYFLTL